MDIKIHTQDYARFTINEEMSIAQVEKHISNFRQYLISDEFKNFIKERSLYPESLERILVDIIWNSSLKNKQNETLNREDKMIERHDSNLYLDGKKSTDKATQFKMHLIDYLLYGDGSTRAPYLKEMRIIKYRKCSQATAIRISANLLISLGLYEFNLSDEERENLIQYPCFRYDFIKKINNGLKYSYVNEYVPTNIPGFPKHVTFLTLRGLIKQTN